MRWEIKKKNEHFKCKFETFLAVESAIYLHVKVAELNTLSAGKGITGIHTFFLMRWKIKKLTNFKCKFETFLALESTIYLHIKVAELNTLSDGKGITCIHSVFFE